MSASEIIRDAITFFRRHFWRLLPPVIAAGLLAQLLAVARLNIDQQRIAAYRSSHQLDDVHNILARFGATDSGLYSLISFLLVIAFSFAVALIYSYAFAIISKVVRDHSLATDSRQSLPQFFRLREMHKASASFATRILISDAFLRILLVGLGTRMAAIYNTPYFLPVSYTLSVVGGITVCLFLARYAYDIPLAIVDSSSEPMAIVLTSKQRRERTYVVLATALFFAVWEWLTNSVFPRLLTHAPWDSTPDGHLTILMLEVLQYISNALPYAFAFTALAIAAYAVLAGLMPKVETPTAIADHLN